MALNAGLAGENGQFYHASRLTWVTCLLTLHLCIAYPHATAAPMQYWPVRGNALLYGHRAANVHSEQITERALKATQAASQLVYAERLKDLAIESYDSTAESCNRQRATMDLDNTQPCQGIDTARAITNSSFARLSPQPRRPADASAPFHVQEQGKPKFEEAICSKLPRVGVPRPTEDADRLRSLLTNNENKAMSGRPLQQYLAATAAYQHQQITGVPLQSSLFNSQEWCRSIRISAITKDIGVQSSEEAVAIRILFADATK